MIDSALPYLRCPVCEDPLGRPDARTLRCPRAHSFDIARQGYVNLTTGRMPHAGDTADMVADRDAFLAAGHYDFIAGALTRAVAGRDGLVVDAGTGTGTYLARVLDALPGAIGLGLDVAKPALRRAARCHPRAGAALTDLWQPLPLADASATAILDVFAPRNGPEFRRILRPDGVLLVVTPAADHLRELIGPYGMIRIDPDKADRVSDTLGAHFVATATATHRRTMRLSGAEVRTLIGMTPSARHMRLDDLPEDDVSVEAAIHLTAYHPT